MARAEHRSMGRVTHVQADDVLTKHAGGPPDRATELEPDARDLDSMAGWWETPSGIGSDDGALIHRKAGRAG